MGAIYKSGVYREMTAAEETENDAIQKQIADSLPAQQEKTSRQMRDGLLADCDWTQAGDSPLTSAKKSAWGTYRAALRNLPTADAEWPDPVKITWPTEPS